MTVENYLAEAGAPAGLALAAVVRLLTADSENELATADIIVLSAASVMFSYSLLVEVLSLAAAAELYVVPTKLDNLNFVSVCMITYASAV